MKKQKIKKKKIYKSTILFIILDILAICGFIMMYGPWDEIRNLYVNTAMKTKDHKYLANIFYSQETIDGIMASNYFITIKEDVELDDIIIDTSPKESYVKQLYCPFLASLETSWWLEPHDVNDEYGS